MTADGGVKTMLVTVAGDTVRVAVPLTAPLLAVITTVPAVPGYASPVVGPIVAVVWPAGTDQVTWFVMFWWVVSEYVPVAVN
jgi:hypothetical protein